MNASQEALTQMHQIIKETMASNLKMAALASLLTGGAKPELALSISSNEAEGLARQIMNESLAQNLKLAALAGILTGDDQGAPRTVQHVDGGPNSIKPPPGTGVHGY
jgi:hypothetical protein